MAFLLRSLVPLPVWVCLLCLCCGNATWSFAQETSRPVDASPFVDDAQDAALDRDAKQLAMRLRSAGPDQRAALKQELKSLNEKHFDYRQQRRKRELDELTAGVERLRSAYQKRQDQRADVLARRFSDLTDPNASLGWDDVAESTNNPKTEANAKVSSVSPDSTSTFNGVTLTQWLKTLEHERNRQKVADAVIALNHLVDQADPDELLSALFKFMTTQVDVPYDQYSDTIYRGAICLLIQLPIEHVTEAIQSRWKDDYSRPEPRKLISRTLADIATKTDEDDSGEFLARFPLARRQVPITIQNLSTRTMFQLQSNKKMLPLQAAVKALAPSLIQLLVKAAERNPELRTAAVADGNLVLRISRQSLTSYPEFVPIVEADLDDPKSNHIAAARLLAEVGLKTPKVIEFVNLQFASVGKNSMSLEDTLRYLELLAPHAPETVDVLIERFRKECEKLVGMMKSRDSNDISGIVQNQTDCCGQYILALARMGKPAERVIPELQKIVESTQTEAGGPIKIDSSWPWPYHRFWFDLTGDTKSPFTLQELSDAAIKVIQNSTAKAPPTKDVRAAIHAPITDISATPATTKNRSELVKRREQAEAQLKHLESQGNTGETFEEMYKHAKERVLLLKELEALSATNNTSNAKPADSNEEPTYKGVVLSEWMRTLKHERDRAKIADAVMAANYLVDQADPDQMIQIILSVLKSETKRANQDSFTPMIRDGALLALIRLPARLVVDQLVVNFNDSSVPADLSQSLALSNFRNAFGQLLRHLAVKKRTPIGYPSHRIYINDPVAKINLTFPESKDSENALRAEIRRRSRHLIRILSDVARIEPKLRSWAITTADPILRISQQPITTYPELIPIAEAVVEDPKMFGQLTAAELLAESGVQIPKVMTCLRQAIERQPDQPHMGNLLPDSVINALILAANHSPDAVELLVDQLRSNPPEAPQQRNIQCLFALAAIRAPARPAIPFLKEMRNSKAAGNLSPYHPYFDRTELPLLATATAMGGSPPEQAARTVREVVDAAIKEIETDKPKPAVEPLPEVDASSSSSTATPNVTGAKLGTFESKLEPTFDGTPYSAWLKMLETERKPEKLGQAIEATTRLTPAIDQERIAKAIFTAASYVERETDRSKVWEPGFSGLRRLPAPIVMAAFVEALGDTRDQSSSRQFQGIFAAYRTSKEMDTEIQKNATTVIQLLLERGSNPESASDDLALAALQFIKQFHLDLSQFPLAKDIGLHCVEKGARAYQPSESRNFGEELPGWWRVTDTLIELAPETTGLPEALIKYAQSAPEVMERIGRLGEHARSLTPQLVELFVKACVPPESPGRTSWKFPSAECLQIVKVLGQIGADGDGYRLLKECHMLQTPSMMKTGLFSESEKLFFQTVDEALSKLTPPSNSGDQIPILSDEIRLSGVWLWTRDPSVTIKLTFPSSSATRELMMVRRMKDGTIELVPDGLKEIGFSDVKVPASIRILSENPKSLVPVERRNDQKKCHYELTEKSLRLLVVSNEVDTPLPDKFPSPDKPLPKGVSIWEFQRDPPVPTATAPDR